MMPLARRTNSALADGMFKPGFAKGAHVEELHKREPVRQTAAGG